MSEIIKLVPYQNKISDDAPEVLRKLADDIEAGTVTEMVLACVYNDEYELMRFSSLSESLVLSSLLHHSILRGFRADEE